MAVAIPNSVLEALFDAASALPDHEICGLLFGSSNEIMRAERTANVAERPRDSFEIDPRALFAALRAERAGGDRLIGHYHSHPNGLATPSPRDLAAAEPGRLWLIIGGQTARLWTLENGVFRELQLVVRD